MCWYYGSLQSRGKDAYHKFHLPVPVLRIYSFDNSAEANDNATHPHGKSLLGKKEPNESRLT